MRAHVALVPLLAAFLWTACAGEAEAPPAAADPAQAIVDQAIAAHGGEVLQHAVVQFGFRGQHYTITRDGGRYRYERTFTDSTGRVHDVMDNDGIRRAVDGQPVPLTDRQKRSIATPLNSVPYFALLPFNLNDPAVEKRYLEAAEVDGEPYHKVEVTFGQGDGGKDFEDRFVYWFHQDRHTMDYLAYDFYDAEDDQGTRFRQAVNVRTVGGVRFADYLNYASEALPAYRDPIERYDSLMQATDLELLSEIVLENVSVQPLGL